MSYLMNYIFSLKKYVQRVLLILCMLFIGSSYGAEGQSFIETDEPFFLIKDANRQSEAWATCSAAYEILSTMLKSESPAQSDQFHQFANGAKLAVLMSFLVDAIKDIDESDDASVARFNASFTYGKVAMESLPETKASSLMAIFESGGDKNQERWMANLGTTVKHCVDNLDGQQSHIDLWRSIATSGLLKLE